MREIFEKELIEAQIKAGFPGTPYFYKKEDGTYKRYDLEDAYQAWLSNEVRTLPDT